MFNNAYKGNFAVFALIFGNLFPQNNIGRNPIICDMFSTSISWPLQNL